MQSFRCTRPLFTKTETYDDVMIVLKVMSNYVAQEHSRTNSTYMHLSWQSLTQSPKIQPVLAVILSSFVLADS